MNKIQIMGLKKRPYKYLIKEEAKAFDKQATLRTKKGLIPDIRKLKKNKFFYNNPYREAEFYKIQWQPIINKIILISKKNKQKKVLEVGCGTGFLSLELALPVYSLFEVNCLIVGFASYLLDKCPPLVFTLL